MYALTESSHEGPGPYVCSVHSVCPPIPCCSDGFYASEPARQALPGFSRSHVLIMNMAARLASTS